MSIIQEALRRKEQDAAPSSGARPGAPAPAPGPHQPPPLPGKRHRAAPWLLILLLLACLGAAGYFAYYFLRLEWGRRGAPALPFLAVKPPAESRQPAAAEPARPLPQTVLTARREPAGTATGAAPRAVTPAPTANVPTPAAAPVAAPPPAPRAPSSPLARLLPERKPAPPPAPAEQAPAAHWPELKLKGIMAAGGAQAATALINNEMAVVGEDIMGVRVIQIRADEVTLEWQGRRQRLRVGQSTAGAR